MYIYTLFSSRADVSLYYAFCVASCFSLHSFPAALMQRFLQGFVGVLAFINVFFLCSFWLGPQRLQTVPLTKVLQRLKTLSGWKTTRRYSSFPGNSHPYWQRRLFHASRINKYQADSNSLFTFNACSLLWLPETRLQFTQWSGSQGMAKILLRHHRGFMFKKWFYENWCLIRTLQ